MVATPAGRSWSVATRAASWRSRSRLRQPSEAEDLVQETFLSFLKSLATFRAEASLETYLFLILRRKIADHYRGQKLTICLLQDLYPAEAVQARLPAPWTTFLRGN